MAALVLAATPWAAGQELPRELTTVDGKSLNLADGPTELLFVARWCGPCEREITLTRRRLAEFQRRGYRVVIVGVVQRQTAQQLEEWARAAGWDGPLVFDQDRALELALSAKLIPWFTVLGADGKPLHNGESAPTPEQLRGWLRP